MPPSLCGRSTHQFEWTTVSNGGLPLVIVKVPSNMNSYLAPSPFRPFLTSNVPHVPTSRGSVFRWPQPTIAPITSIPARAENHVNESTRRLISRRPMNKINTNEPIPKPGLAPLAASACPALGIGSRHRPRKLNPVRLVRGKGSFYTARRTRAFC